MPTVPTTPKGKRTREHILGAARRVFARDGYVGATMSEVATTADLSLGGLYRYFTNKDDLFEQVIADVHEELYEASKAVDHDFATEPFESLLEANYGYLRHYQANHDVMRAFIEAANVDARFREFWWKMRARHIDRFVDAMQKQYQRHEVYQVPIRLAAEAAACMVEQSAYVWYAHEDLHDTPVSLDDASKIVTHAWHNLFFATPGSTTAAD